jgi:hypothetical protein
MRQEGDFVKSEVLTAEPWRLLYSEIWRPVAHASVECSAAIDEGSMLLGTE